MFISLVRFRIPSIPIQYSLKACLASDSSDHVLLKEPEVSAIYHQVLIHDLHPMHGIPLLHSQLDIYALRRIGFSRELKIVIGLGTLMLQCCDCICYFLVVVDLNWKTTSHKLCLQHRGTDFHRGYGKRSRPRNCKSLTFAVQSWNCRCSRGSGAPFWAP